MFFLHWLNLLIWEFWIPWNQPFIKQSVLLQGGVILTEFFVCHRVMLKKENLEKEAQGYVRNGNAFLRM